MKLTPQIVSYAPLLRAIQTGGHDSAVALAEAGGRIANNLNRDLRALEKEELITYAPGAPAWLPRLTPAAAEGLAALDRAEGLIADAPPGLVNLRHDQIEPDPNNARQHIDSFDLNKLRATIEEHGLLQNLVVRPAGPDGKHRLIAGERRWRAIEIAIHTARTWPADKPLPCRIVELESEAEFEVAALIENLSREELHPLDEAAALGRLVNDHGLTTAQAAEKVGRSQRHVQDRLRFIDLRPDLKARMRLDPDNPGHLTATAVRKLIAETKAKAEEVEPTAPLASAAEAESAVVVSPYIRRNCESLKPRELLLIAEVALKIQREPAGERGTLLEGSKLGTNPAIIMAGVSVSWPNGRAYVQLNEETIAWLAEKRLPAEPALGLLRQQVAGIGKEAQLRQSGRYYNAALNPSEPATEPTRSSFSTGGQIADPRKAMETAQAAEAELQALTLSQEERLGLLELAHKIGWAEGRDVTNLSAATHEDWLCGVLPLLGKNGLARIVPTDRGRRAVLSLKGEKKLRMEIGEGRSGVNALILHAARSAVGQADWPVDGGYVTLFLRDPEGSAEPDAPAADVALSSPERSEGEGDHGVVEGAAQADPDEAEIDRLSPAYRRFKAGWDARQALASRPLDDSHCDTAFLRAQAQAGDDPDWRAAAFALAGAITSLTERARPVMADWSALAARVGGEQPQAIELHDALASAFDEARALLDYHGFPAPADTSDSEAA